MKEKKKMHPLFMVILLLVATPAIVIATIYLIWLALVLSIIPLRLASRMTKKVPGLSDKLQSASEGASSGAKKIHNKIHEIAS